MAGGFGSFLGHVAAGAMQGLGQGIVEKAKMDREERLKELDHVRQLARDKSQMAFTAEQNKMTRDAEAADRKATRDAEAAKPVIVGENDTLMSRDGTVIGRGQPKAPGKDKSFENEQGLRKEYIGTPEYKRFDDVRASYDRVRASVARDSGAGDLGVIFGFMKMLDPGSVVREGEFANAENTAGVPEQVRNLYNRVISGERLSPAQREEFEAMAGDLYQEEADRMTSYNERYSGIAAQYGIDPARVVVAPKVYEPRKRPLSPEDPLGIR